MPLKLESSNASKPPTTSKLENEKKRLPIYRRVQKPIKAALESAGIFRYEENTCPFTFDSNDFDL
jgi:hypothetical protein